MLYQSIYLAHYERKQHYKILCSCGDLEVRIPDASPQSQSITPEIEQQSMPNTVETLEIEEALSEYDDEALMLIKLINKDLPNQDTLPMESTLERKVEKLGDLQAKITSPPATASAVGSGTSLRPRPSKRRPSIPMWPKRTNSSTLTFRSKPCWRNSPPIIIVPFRPNRPTSG